ncbi:hypothetical protein F0L74_10300 [Chitinophaga agrisoli]|uniref:Uncharacterized protein n=1 Tax=Chitinophaga agrisoli TaxID=2607653 RepID=A0A5B2VW92_9BACT|nr:hypothetical protein [Chitinophaga agrisoli]KAA2242910.1 hypothetical protein F0L74_10300 [Chitinophaga agrisoli]
MKNRNILIAVIIGAAISALCAFRIPVQAQQWQYCTITVYARGLSLKTRISIDYGQEKGNRISDANRPKDEQGNLIEFNTGVDALNYMGRDGWKCINASVDTAGGMIQYLLCKPVL